MLTPIFNLTIPQYFINISKRKIRPEKIVVITRRAIESIALYGEDGIKRREFCKHKLTNDWESALWEHLQLQADRRITVWKLQIAGGYIRHNMQSPKWTKPKDTFASGGHSTLSNCPSLDDVLKNFSDGRAEKNKNVYKIDRPEFIEQLKDNLGDFLRKECTQKELNELSNWIYKASRNRKNNEMTTEQIIGALSTKRNNYIKDESKKKQLIFKYINLC